MAPNRKVQSFPQAGRQKGAAGGPPLTAPTSPRAPPEPSTPQGSLRGASPLLAFAGGLRYSVCTGSPLNQSFKDPPQPPKKVIVPLEMLLTDTEMETQRFSLQHSKLQIPAHAKTAASLHMRVPKCCQHWTWSEE